MICEHCQAGVSLLPGRRQHLVGTCLVYCTEPVAEPPRAQAAATLDACCDSLLTGEALRAMIDADRRERDAAHAAEIASLRRRIAALEGQRRAVDEALNSGDGSYRP